MEDLGDWELLGSSLKKKGPNLDVATTLGNVLAKIHLATMKGNVSPDYWKALSKYR